MVDKDWWKSTTFWSGIIMLVSFAGMWSGHTVSSEQGTALVDNLVKIATAVGEIVGIIGVIVGRRNAGKRIAELRMRLNARP